MILFVKHFILRLPKRGDVECHVVMSCFLVLSLLASTDDLSLRLFVLARFLLKDGQLWLCAPQAKQIWKCLAENAVFLCDREACFKWYSLIFNQSVVHPQSHSLADLDLDCSYFLHPKRYSKLMGDEPDLDPDINKDFFENNVLQLDPSLLTENGMKCFERFFKAVNCREGKLVAKRRAYMMDDLELIGLDYLWRVRTFVTQTEPIFFAAQLF